MCSLLENVPLCWALFVINEAERPIQNIFSVNVSKLVSKRSYAVNKYRSNHKLTIRDIFCLLCDISSNPVIKKLKLIITWNTFRHFKNPSHCPSLRFNLAIYEPVLSVWFQEVIQIDHQGLFLKWHAKVNWFLWELWGFMILRRTSFPHFVFNIPFDATEEMKCEFIS